MLKNVLIAICLVGTMATMVVAQPDVVQQYRILPKPKPVPPPPDCWELDSILCGTFINCC